MLQQDEFDSYKLAVTREDTKGFFAKDTTPNWNFKNYFLLTHNSINKYK